MVLFDIFLSSKKQIEKRTGYYVGQQLIVEYGRYGIHHFKRTLRKDSPHRI